MGRGRGMGEGRKNGFREGEGGRERGGMGGGRDGEWVEGGRERLGRVARQLGSTLGKHGLRNILSHCTVYTFHFFCLCTGRCTVYVYEIDFSGSAHHSSFNIHFQTYGLFYF